MQRGVIRLSNQELIILSNFLISKDCQEENLLFKLKPVENLIDQTQELDVLISENEAEIVLDCMPIPSKQDDPNLISARTKLQQFIAKLRFDE
ncbi:MAG: hypothetical protein H6772_04865 [Pseudomonadales bacterium]|nr:hypothetical protein [Pseudomonadales bacterium]